MPNVTNFKIGNKTITIKDPSVDGMISECVKFYKNINEMKAEQNPINGSIVYVAGYFSENDGGDAFYITSTSEETGADVISSSNAYYKLIHNNVVNVSKIGIIPGKGTDCSAILSNYINNSDIDIFVFDEGIYRIDNSITFAENTRFVARGTVEFDCYVNGIVFTILGDDRSGGTDLYYYSSAPRLYGDDGYFYIRDLTVTNNTPVTGHAAFAIGDPGNSTRSYGRFQIRDVRVWYFDYAFLCTPHNFYLTEFYNVHAEFCNTCVVLNRNSGTDNSGENLLFRRCIFSNSKTPFYFGGDGFLHVYFLNSAFDYNGTLFTGFIKQKQIVMTDCHVEQNAYNKFSATVGIATGNGTDFIFNAKGCTFVLTDACKTTLFKGVSNYTFPPVFSDCTFVSSVYKITSYDDMFLAPILSVNNLTYVNNSMPMIGRFNNLIGNGDFSSASGKLPDGFTQQSASSNLTLSKSTSSMTPNAFAATYTFSSAGAGSAVLARTINNISPNAYYYVTFVAKSTFDVRKKVTIIIYDRDNNVINRVSDVPLDAENTTYVEGTTFTRVANFRTPVNADHVYLLFTISGNGNVEDSFSFEYCYMSKLIQYD